MMASAFLFACTDNETPSNDDKNATGKLQFEITAITQADNGVSTKTPLYSQEATQHVTRVTVYAFLDNGTDFEYIQTFEVTGWTDGTDSLVYTVPDANELTAGNYKFLAIGRNETDNFTVTTPTAGTLFEDIYASVTASGNESEIFAGSAETLIFEEGGRVSINMTRKVAGILGYFKNIPAVLDGSTISSLRLTINSTNQEVNLTDSTGGAPFGTSYELINIDLSTQAVVNGIYVGNPFPLGVSKVPNSQLAGTYLIPTMGISMVLGLYDASGNEVRTWNVSDGTSTVFDILANNFYTLGTKLRTDVTTGDDPDDPGDDDNPIDLLTDETITITISPEWTAINNLVLE